MDLREIARKTAHDVRDAHEAHWISIIESALRSVAPRWVPVGDGLPEPLVDVLIHGLDNEFALAYIEENGVWWYHDGDQSRTVTHWMLLPPPPKEPADGK